MLDIIPDETAFEVVIVLFLGLLLGSFSTAIIYRTRQNQSWIWNGKRQNKARSFCPSCGHTLRGRDLLPIFSWLFQRGRCRYCDIKIPLGYVFLEVFSVFICFLLYGGFGFTKQGVFLMLLSSFFVSQGVLAVKYRVLSKLLLSIIFVGGAVLVLWQQ